MCVFPYIYPALQVTIKDSFGICSIVISTYLLFLTYLWYPNSLFHLFLKTYTETIYLSLLPFFILIINSNILFLDEYILTDCPTCPNARIPTLTRLFFHAIFYIYIYSLIEWTLEEPDRSTPLPRKHTYNNSSHVIYIHV